MKATALIMAAGSSERFYGEVPKQFQLICGRPLLAWTVGQFEDAESVDMIVLVAAEDQMVRVTREIVDPYGFQKVTRVICGGATRQESVRLGLESLTPSTGLVAIHDGARPLVSPADIDNVIGVAAAQGAALLATKVSDTVKQVDNDHVSSTLDRELLYLAQTPQVFRYDQILSAHRDAVNNGFATDDAFLMENKGIKVRVVQPIHPNIKVTTREDLIVAEALIRGKSDD
jgi:2-C-methyl-D-erythritol 4-phosphate cytidylyltransferase